jgi:hypothetical protein
VRRREESMALDVRLPRTVPSKLTDGGGGDATRCNKLRQNTIWHLSHATIAISHFVAFVACDKYEKTLLDTTV